MPIFADPTSTPITTPIDPPISDSSTASSRNWPRMSLRWAPIALRMPISRVRSVTVTSMMFMTPIPPTSSEIAATAPSSSVNVPVTVLTVVQDRARVEDREIGRRRA